VHHPPSDSRPAAELLSISHLRAVATLPDPLDRQADAHGGFEAVTRSLVEQVGAQTALLVVCGEDDELAPVRASWGLATETRGTAIRRGEGVVGRLLAGNSAGARRLAPDDLDPVGDTSGERAIVAAVGAPIQSYNGVVGALCVGFSRWPRAECGHLVWTAQAYAAVAALCLDGSGLLGTLIEATRRDTLTGCLNYAALQESITREVSRCERHERDLACCFLDLDGFKDVNDTYGHLHGNRVLTTVADTLRSGVRDSDMVGRYGGDEFVLILPDTARSSALLLVERLRVDIAEATQAVGGPPTEVSVGVAEWSPGRTSDRLLHEADESLRIAKEAGGGVFAARAVRETLRTGSLRRSPGPTTSRRASNGQPPPSRDPESG
jgi:diguanylate cyclase (GGDEF)-like protein